MPNTDTFTPPGVALVLEGGGFRGMFTAGALERLMCAGIAFERVIGVSAGAAYGVSYVTRQIGRNLAVSNGYAWSKRYKSLGNLLRKGSLFDWEFVYGEVPRRLVPLDYDELARSPTRFEVVVTSCRTGLPAYREGNGLDPDGLKDLLAATSALPFISPMITLNGEPYMDGGISDSIPIARALATGSDRVVVVLTHPAGFRRKRSLAVALARLRYQRYPELGAAFARRAEAYNAALDRLDALERDGRAFVIRPQAPIRVGRTENDAAKLEALFHDAERLTERRLPELVAWTRAAVRKSNLL